MFNNVDPLCAGYTLKRHVTFQSCRNISELSAPGLAGPFQVNRIPLRYEVPLWELAFPAGMYGVASDLLGHAAGLRLVSSTDAIENQIALARFSWWFQPARVPGQW